MASYRSDAHLHVFMVSYPAQGHVNPLLRLGNCLASRGLLVTFSTPESFGRVMRKANDSISDQPTPVGDGAIRFEFFDDEVDENENLDYNWYLPHLELIGRQKLPDLLKKQEEEGHPPVSCLINNPFIPWASDVAESLGIPSALLWVQSCACFSAYFHYYHGLVPFPTEAEPELDVQLPCSPLLKYDEVPSLLHPSTPYGVFRRLILGQYEHLSQPFCILLDTIQELEHELIEHMSKLLNIKPIGPLFKNHSVTCSKIRADTLKADSCIQWLDTKPPSSVIYIAFGTIVHLKQQQVDEIAHGLLSSEVSFLWVMRPPYKGVEPHVLPDGFLERAGDKGKVVQWSPQEEVLAHPSVACFLSHCGWNSTMEALGSGVPLLAFPQWGDQVTNAKYLVDEFRVGIRLCRGAAEDRIIPRDEVEKSLREATSGSKAAEMKENALRWQKKAEEAISEGGSSARNMQAFMDELIDKTKRKKTSLPPPSVKMS